MGDFVALGLEGADKLIDKHFDKVPDKFVNPETYKPRRFRKGSKDSNNSQHNQQQRDRYHSNENPDTERHHHHYHQPHYRSHSPEPEIEIMGDHYNGRPLNNANSSPYLQDGPFITPPWNIQGVQGNNASSPQFSPRDTRARQDNYAYSTHGAQSSSRPVQLRRRSSSYHGPRQRDGFYSSDDSDDERSYRRRDNQLVTRPHHNGAASTHTKSSHEHHDLKDKIGEQFTDSKEGLAGGALGAVVGGYLTHKALESRGKDRSNADTAWTLLGAAVGGLAVNAVVDKWEDKKKDDKKSDRARQRDRRDSLRSERARSERGRRDWDSDYDDRDRRYYH